LLFFVDADTAHRPEALRTLVTAMEGERADMVSGFPRQEVTTWGEKLTVPFFSWVMYCFVPLGVSYRTRLPALAYAVGQLLVVRRAAYEGIGGHGAVRSSIAEDVALARRTAALGYRWRMIQATHLVSCRMYHSGREAFAGLSKNLFAVFDFRLVPYLFAWLWLFVMFLKPVYDLGTYALGSVLAVPFAAVLACIALALVLWLVVYHELALPLWPAALYPVTMLVMEAVAFRSLWLSLRGGLRWKSRSLVRPRVSWW
jgi:chlorobactene glucosyltransferase